MSIPSPRSSDEVSDGKHYAVDSKAYPALESAGAEVVKKSWFRGTIFQAVIVGLCSFLSPGTWNAMSATGAGGAQVPYLVNAGNALVFGLMVFTCTLGSKFFPSLSLFSGSYFLSVPF